MGSRLLISWAPHVTHMEFNDHISEIPGAADFLSAARRLAHVKARCESPSVAAELDRLLKGNSSITGLECVYLYVPCLFPPKLDTLVIKSYLSQGTSDGLEANALIVRLDTWAMHLRRLSIELRSCPILTSKTILPMLDTLCIRLSVGSEGSAPVQLDWLRRQPYKVLELTIEVFRGDVAKNMQALAAIQGLTLHSCSLNFWCPLSAAMQQVWQGLSTLERVQLNVYDEVESLIAFPCSPHLDVIAQHNIENFSFSWAALARQPRSIRLDLCGSDSVVVTGCPDGGLAPFTGTELPWQLCIDDGGEYSDHASIVGLPASQPCREQTLAYFLQNDAARSAGWTQETGHSP